MSVLLSKFLNTLHRTSIVSLAVCLLAVYSDVVIHAQHAEAAAQHGTLCDTCGIADCCCQSSSQKDSCSGPRGAAASALSALAISAAGCDAKADNPAVVPDKAVTHFITGQRRFLPAHTSLLSSFLPVQPSAGYNTLVFHPPCA